jgi:hypothetical protein
MKNFLLFLIILSIFQSCHQCNCGTKCDDNFCDLEGFYVFPRKHTRNKEFLWIFNNHQYIHCFVYSSEIFINSDVWTIEKGSNSIDNFIAENWISPCGIECTFEPVRLYHVTKSNFESYKGSEAQLNFGCQEGIGDTCSFRLWRQMEPDHFYKKIFKSDHVIKPKRRPIKFYTERDSLMFTTLNGYKYISLR